MLFFSFVARYCLRAKRIFNDLHEQPFVVELDLRGIYWLLFLVAAVFYKHGKWLEMTL